MQIDAVIVGITPLMLNRYSDEAAMKASSGTSGASAAADRGTPHDIAENKLYRGAEGELCIPQPNLLRCIVDGGQFHKAGKTQITTKEKSVLFGCLDILGATIPLISKDGWHPDSRPVVIPATKGRILAHRPVFNDWRLEFSMELDTSIVSVGLLRVIVDDAGKRVGLGDFRPARKGPFGRFRVDAWVEHKTGK